MKFNVTQITSNEVVSKVDKRYTLNQIAMRLSVLIANEVLSDDSCLTKKEVGSGETIEQYEVYVFSLKELKHLIQQSVIDLQRGRPVLL